METRVEACQRQHSGSFKRAHIGGFAGAITVFAMLILSKLMNFPSVWLTWKTVAVFPLVVYAIVFFGMLWNFARAMKTSRALDDAEQQPFGSVGAPSNGRS